MTALDRAIELFAIGHADELTGDESFTLGAAAAIIARVHADVQSIDGPAYPLDVDGGPLNLRPYRGPS